MKVKNILVTCEKDIFIDLLIKELINNEISFVQVENELHFEDNIYRFYDKKDYDVAVKQSIEVLHILDIPFIFANEIKTPLLDDVITRVEGNTRLNMESNKGRKRITKNYIKSENQKYNQYIKSRFRSLH